MSSASRRLVLGQAAGQLCTVAAIPVLARWFPPEQMGAFQLAASVALLVQPLATWGHTVAIPLAATPEEALVRRGRARRLLTGVTLTIGAGALVALACGEPRAAATVGMIAGLVLAYGGLLVDNAHLVRLRAEGRLAARNFLTGFLTAFFQVLAAAALHDVSAMVLGVLAGRAVAVLVTRPRGVAVAVTSARNGLSAPARWGLVTGLSQTASIAAMQVPTVVMPVVGGLAAAGLAGLALRLAGAPLAFVGQALGQIGQSALAPVLRSGRGSVGAVVRAHLRRTVPAAGLVAAVLVVAAPLAPLVLGQGWASSAPIVAVLAVPCSMQLVVSSLGATLAMLGHAAALLRIQLARVAVNALAIVVAGNVARPTGNVLAMCATYAVAETAACLVLVVATLVTARRADRRRDGGAPAAVPSTPATGLARS